MAHNPQSEMAPEPQTHQYPTAQLSALSEATQDEDRYLVLRAQDGDIDAFEKLVERYQGRLFRSAYMIVRNRQDSEDIVQDTLVQAWRSLHLVREPAAFRGWIMQICTNNMVRKRQRRATDPYDAEGLEGVSAAAEMMSSSTADPADSSEVNAQIQALANLLASVEPELRIVWILREIDEMSYEEIAKTLNLTVSTVRGRLARARSLVIRLMKEWA